MKYYIVNKKSGELCWEEVWQREKNRWWQIGETLHEFKQIKKRYLGYACKILNVPGQSDLIQSYKKTTKKELFLHLL